MKLEDQNGEFNSVEIDEKKRKADGLDIDLENGEIPTPLAEKKVKTKTCKYFLKGKCRKGDNCSYKHEAVAAPPKRKPLFEQVFFC